MRAYRRLRKTAKKLEDKEILNETINSVLMGTSDVNHQSIEEILDEVIGKVVENAEEKQRGPCQMLKTETERRSKGRKKVLTSTHGGEVIFNFCNFIEYQISHTFQTCEIL